MMRIGVVCEGPTDFHSIQAFFGHSLSARGVDTEFVPLQPKMDNTQPKAGWGNALLWLKNNPPAARIQKYFGGGLFAGVLATEKLDALLVQLDTDVLGEAGFSTFVVENYGYTVSNPGAADARAQEIREVVTLASRFVDMTDDDVGRHVIAPAVESTEAWCIAAFTTPSKDFEALAGQQLTDEFMTALELCEGRTPRASYAKVDKSPKRRERFCNTHAHCSERILIGCAQFRATHDQLVALS